MDSPQRRRGHWELLNRAANFPLMDQFGPGYRAIVLIKKKNRKFCRAHDFSESPKPRRISGELSLSTPIEYGKMVRRGPSKRREFPLYVVLGNFAFFSGPLFTFFPHAATRGSCCGTISVSVRGRLYYYSVHTCAISKYHVMAKSIINFDLEKLIGVTVACHYC